MAACGSLRSLPDNPLPESQTITESPSLCSQIPPVTPIEAASIADIFGELYFRDDKPDLRAAEPPSVPPALDKNAQKRDNQALDSLLGGHSSKNNETLRVCTEGLGSESSDSDDVVDALITENGRGRSLVAANGANGYTRSGWNGRSARSPRVFPPPISSIGKGGRPWVCLRPYREDGRFVLRETMIPCQELLHASRKSGRLKLHFVHPVEASITEGDEEEEEEEEEEEHEAEAEGVGTEVSKKKCF